MKFFLPTSVAFLPLLVSSISGSVYNGYNSTYSFDLSCAQHPSWMRALPDSATLSSLSIPGTHDTMTSNPSIGEVYQCQNAALSTQLTAGMRYFDIRLTNVNGSFQVYHGDHYTGFSFATVLETLFGFLKRYPSETILMRLKEEGSPVNSTIGFEDLFNYYRLNSSFSSSFTRHLWLPSTVPVTTLPTLGALRAKIVVLQNFGPTPARYGVSWDAPLLAIEDDYEIADYAGLDAKFEAIQRNVLDAGNATDGRLYLSHVSGSVGVLPIEVAAGTRNGSVVGENDRVGKWLEGKKVRGPLGVVILDFPGGKVVDEVVRRN